MRGGIAPPWRRLQLRASAARPSHHGMRFGVAGGSRTHDRSVTAIGLGRLATATPKHTSKLVPLAGVAPAYLAALRSGRSVSAVPPQGHGLGEAAGTRTP